MLRHVALVRTDVSEELSAIIIRVTRSGDRNSVSRNHQPTHAVKKYEVHLALYFCTACVSC
jgi:hypothetical protein